MPNEEQRVFLSQSQDKNEKRDGMARLINSLFHRKHVSQLKIGIGFIKMDQLNLRLDQITNRVKKTKLKNGTF